MSIPCFYVPQLAAEAMLEGDEARHLARVLRLLPGDRARLLDGHGGVGLYAVARIEKKAVFLQQLEFFEQPRPRSRAIMALALSRAVRRSFFLEKSVELGAEAVWIWQARRSQGRLDRSAQPAWERQLRAGAKQCVNPWLPEIRVFPGGAEEVAAAAAIADWRLLPFEQLENVPMLQPGQAGREGCTVYAIGPEGGFAPEELACFEQAGFDRVSLGGRVLRCETAAVLCLGLHWWAAQLPGAPDWREGS